MGRRAESRAQVVLIIGMGVIGVGVLTALAFLLLGWAGLPLPSGWFGFAIGVVLSLANGWRSTRARTKGAGP